MTAKQTALFRNCIRLCREVPGATILTFGELIRSDTIDPYRAYINRLPVGPRLFFENEFTDTKQYGATKNE